LEKDFFYKKRLMEQASLEDGACQCHGKKKKKAHELR
jgi:hypothetical protein